MPLARKRRSGPDAEPSPAPVRRRRSPSASEASSVADGNDGADGVDGDSNGGSSHDQMVKKLVRLALASEYSRTPIRRTDINAKVMAPNTARQYKHVFADAQDHLRSIFGMEMTELPQKEKITVSQKRAAKRSGNSQSSSAAAKVYIVTSTLPSRYRTPSILPPSCIQSTAAEAAYTGLYSFVISIIWLSAGGKISENHLEQALKRMNADNCVLNGERTDTVLKKMERQGYIVKVKERDGGGEETVDYVVGPRGKAEVGERGVAGVVRRVYKGRNMQDDELERRLVRSLGDVVIEKRNVRDEAGEGEGGDGEAEGEGETQDADEEERSRSRGGRRQRRKSDRRRGRGAVVEEEAEAEDEQDDEDGGEEEEEEEEDENEDEDEDE